MKKSVLLGFSLLLFIVKEGLCNFTITDSNNSSSSPLVSTEAEFSLQNSSSTTSPNLQWVKSTTQAYTGKARWIIEGFSYFGNLESPSFSHEYRSLNWSLILDRFQENFFLNTYNFKFNVSIYARISLTFETCMGKTVSKEQMKWICSTWCNRDPIYLNDLKAIEDAASLNNDTMVIHAEFTIFDDERHDHHRIRTDFESESKTPEEICEMGSDLFRIEEW